LAHERRKFGGCCRAERHCNPAIEPVRLKSTSGLHGRRHWNHLAGEIPAIDPGDARRTTDVVLSQLKKTQVIPSQRHPTRQEKEGAMGILGLTHDESGAALEKLPVTIKVAIGEGPKPDDGNSSPRALFHFVFKRRAMRGQIVYWTAADIAEVFGTNQRNDSDLPS